MTARQDIDRPRCVRPLLHAVIAASLLCAASGSTAWGQCQVQKLVASDGEADDVFGGSVALSLNLALIGAPFDDDNGEDSGSAYVFRFNGASWIEDAKLVASDGAEYDSFGSSVAIDDDLAIVGAPRGGSALPGAVYVFHQDGPTWVEEAKLVASDGSAQDAFGCSVAIDGHRVVVGAFTAVSGLARPGAAYVYRREQSNWVEECKLLASDGEDGDWFGRAVALDGEVAVIGAPRRNDNGALSGAAYLYRFDGSAWHEEAKLLASDGWWACEFGYSVALAGDTVIIGAPVDRPTLYPVGAAYTFHHNGSAWVEQAKLWPSDGMLDDHFGASVQTSGDVAIVGSPLNGENGAWSGAAYFDRWDGAGGIEEVKVTATPGGFYEWFGTQLAADGDTVLITAPGDDDNGDAAGAAYVFTLSDTDCNGNGVCDSLDILNGTSQDCNANGLPDECETDCNGNGVPDDCDIVNGTSADCNGDGIPDECGLAYSTDDGEAEIGLLLYGDLIWLSQFTVQPGEETIVAIRLCWWDMPDGKPATLLVYDDPDNDGDPTDAVLLRAVPVETVAMQPDEFVDELIDPTFVGQPGDSFFIGAYKMTSGVFAPAALDRGFPHHGQSWVAGADAGEVNLENLADNPHPPRHIEEVCFGGNWLLRAVTSLEVTCCLADVNGDMTVDVLDLLMVLAAWGATSGPEDINGDGIVNVLDLLEVLAAWGPC